MADAQRDVIDQLSPRSPALADIVVRLLDDHVRNEHHLNLTTGLLNAARRPRLIGLLVELAEGAALRPYRQSLADFLAEHPGVGDLFAPVGADVNLDGEGRSRKQLYVDALKVGDPARTVGPQPTPAQFILVEDYAATLASRVLATAIAEVLAAVAGRAAHVSGRAKDAAALIDKVVRMTSGSEGRPPRPEFRVGDIIDAVGTRITVPDMATLSAVLEQVKTHFGTGDGGRILEIENMYAEPKSKNPDYRVITLTIAIDVDGKPYAIELQLTTERASVAADLEHNTIYKAHIPISQRQRRTVRNVMREAAGLDQRETVTHE